MGVADNATTVLGDLSDLLKELYFPELIEVSYRHGNLFTRMFAPRSEPVKGDGENFKFETAKGDTIRFSRSPLRDFAAPRPFQADELKVRFSENSATNDFSEISGSGQVSHLDIINAAGSEGSIVKMAERIVKQVREDFQDKLALHHNIDQTAKVALVNGTRKNNDSWYMDGASSYTTDATSMRCYIDGGSIAAFKPGRVFDIYDSSGNLHFAGAEVTDINADDGSVGFERHDEDSTADFDDVADNDIFYLSGERNAGMYGMAAWMSRPTDGETFIGGVDRSDADKRYMIPQATREGASAAVFSKSHFDDAAIAAGFVYEEDAPVTILADPKLTQAIRNEFGEDAFVQIPTGDDRMKRFANIGSMGLNYQHPQYGIVKVMQDALVTPNSVRILTPADWLMLYYGYKGLQFMPTGEGQGVWYRMESDTPGNGKSKYYKCDAYVPGVTAFCTRPNRQCTILNVTAS
jgi:hypothetical protein